MLLTTFTLQLFMRYTNLYFILHQAIYHFVLARIPVKTR